MDPRAAIQQQDPIITGPHYGPELWQKLENMECRLMAALDPTGASVQSVAQAQQSVRELSAAVASANSAAQVAGTAAEVTSAASPILRKLEAMEELGENRGRAANCRRAANCLLLRPVMCR